jgi:uncharacterized membrane protein YgcG
MPKEKIDVTARAYLDRGLKELEAGNNQEALSQFTHGIEIYGSGEASASTHSATRAALNHAIAVANLRLNQLSAARSAMDLARNSKWTNDSLVFNAGSVYATAKLTAVQAVSILGNYLDAHPDADEAWVNVYGLALQRATPDAEARKRLAKRYETLDAAQAHLEKTKPGKHRWGNTWVDDKTWQDLQSKVNTAKQQLAQIQAKIDSAQMALQNAQQRQGQGSGSSSSGGGSSRRRGGGGGGSRPPAQAGQDPVSRARMQLTAAQKEMAQADKGPQAPWELQLTGMIPEIEMTKEGKPGST